MEYAIVAIVSMCAGYLLCYVKSDRRRDTQEQPAEQLVKRVKPSLRSPLKTSKVQYDQYRSEKTGLYAPVKPKADSKDEVQIGR